jgi:hypothetical protein
MRSSSLVLAAVVAFASMQLVASMLPEDTIGTTDWTKWT